METCVSCGGRGEFIVERMPETGQDDQQTIESVPCEVCGGAR